MVEVVEGKRVTWAEGFFDLVFVLAITQVATLLGEHHQWWGLGRALIVLALVYRTWVTTSLQTNRLSRDSTRDRITLFGVGLCGVGMAIAIPTPMTPEACSSRSRTGWRGSCSGFVTSRSIGRSCPRRWG